MRKNFLKYGNLVAFIAVVILNIMATTGMIGGFTTRDISYMYKSLLTPSDYAFSIWSLIYILIAIMVYLQMKKEDIRDSLGFYFIISCVLNVGWILAWQFRLIALSFVIILALLVILLIIMSRVRDCKMLTTSAVGLYTGWINVAMLANLGAVFTSYNSNWFFSGISSKAWAIVGLCFGILWISFFLYYYKNIYYALGSCWGYLGIVTNSKILPVKIVALVGMVVFAGIGIFIILSKKKLDLNKTY